MCLPPINFKAVVKDLHCTLHVYFAKEHRLQIIGRLYSKDEAASSTLHNYYAAVCVCLLVQWSPHVQRESLSIEVR